MRARHKYLDSLRNMAPCRILQWCCKGCNVGMWDLLGPVLRYFWGSIGKEGRGGVVAVEATSLKRNMTSAKQSAKNVLCLYQTSPKNFQVYISREVLEGSRLPSSTKTPRI